MARTKIKRRTRAAGIAGAWLGGILVAALWASLALGQGTAPAPAADLSLDGILSGVEERYAGVGFSARFEQRSILKALDITDTASGTILVKRPGKMRWTYETPEKQIIITDGIDLWIYKPEDNQVALGRAPAFFAGGKGANFLSDMKQVREKFDIRLENSETADRYVLNLTPRGANLDITAIYLTVSSQNFEIIQIVTYNAYGDENRIDLHEIVYEDVIDDALFTFRVPKGTDVLRLDE